MNKNMFEMTVCVNGRPIREYGHRGLTFVEGRKNTPYTIKFRNNSAQRVLAVFSVDGMSVLDEGPADNESRGYVVPAFQQIEITGWRESLDETCEFVFGAKEKANATQKQKDDSNCGVIAVKVFAEQVKLQDIVLNFPPAKEEHHHHHHHYPPITPIRPPWEPIITWGGTSAVGEEILRSHTVCNNGGEATYGVCVDDIGLPKGAAGSPGPVGAKGTPGDPGMSSRVLRAMNMSAAPAQENPDFNLGTGWGKAKADRVMEVNFDRGVEIAEFSIYYSDEAGLRAAGIDVDKKPAVSKPVLPRGFGGFCKRPVITSS